MPSYNYPSLKWPVAEGWTHYMNMKRETALQTPALLTAKGSENCNTDV